MKPLTTMPRSKDRSRSEREKLREMNYKEKLQYLISYYGIQFLVIAATLGITISVLTTCVNRPDIGLTIDWGATYIDQFDFDDMVDVLEQRLFGDSGQVVHGMVNYVYQDDPSYMIHHYERLAAMVAAGSVDIFILSPGVMKEYALLQFIMPLDEILMYIESINPGIYDKITEQTVTADFGDNDVNPVSGEGIAGVRITESALFDDLTYSLYGEVYLCVSSTSKNHENAALALIEYYK